MCIVYQALKSAWVRGYTKPSHKITKSLGRRPGCWIIPSMTGYICSLPKCIAVAGESASQSQQCHHRSRQSSSQDLLPDPDSHDSSHDSILSHCNAVHTHLLNLLLHCSSAHVQELHCTATRGDYVLTIGDKLHMPSSVISFVLPAQLITNVWRHKLILKLPRTHSLLTLFWGWSLLLMVSSLPYPFNVHLQHVGTAHAFKFCMLHDVCIRARRLEQRLLILVVRLRALNRSNIVQLYWLPNYIRNVYARHIDDFISRKCTVGSGQLHRRSHTDWWAVSMQWVVNIVHAAR